MKRQKGSNLHPKLWSIAMELLTHKLHKEGTPQTPPFEKGGAYRREKDKGEDSRKQPQGRLRKMKGRMK